MGARGGGGAEGASTVTSKKERSTPVPDRERDREHHQAPGSASSSAALSGRVGKSNKNSTSAGASASASTTPRDAKSAQKLLFSLHDAISGHRNGNVFQGPVRKVSSDASMVVTDPERGRAEGEKGEGGRGKWGSGERARELCVGGRDGVGSCPDLSIPFLLKGFVPWPSCESLHFEIVPV